MFLLTAGAAKNGKKYLCRMPTFNVRYPKLSSKIVSSISKEVTVLALAAKNSKS